MKQDTPPLKRLRGAAPEPECRELADLSKDLWQLILPYFSGLDVHMFRRVCKGFRDLCHTFQLRVCLFPLSCHVRRGKCKRLNYMLRVVPKEEVVAKRHARVLELFPEERRTFYYQEGKLVYLPFFRPQFGQCNVCKRASVTTVVRKKFLNKDEKKKKKDTAMVCYWTEATRSTVMSVTRLSFTNDYLEQAGHALPASFQEAKLNYKYNGMVWGRIWEETRQCLLCSLCEGCFFGLRANFYLL